MAKPTGKMRFDLYLEYSNGKKLKEFASRNSVSVNSLINMLIVQFLINDNTFNFAKPSENKQSQNIAASFGNDDINGNDDGDCLPDILKQLLNDNNNDSLEYDF